MTEINCQRDDPRTVDQLVNAALSEQDEDLAWDAVVALHWRGNQEVLQRAIGLCRHHEPQKRCLGADILGQLGVPDRTFPRECSETLLGMLATEDQASVLQSVLVALSHLREVEAILPATRFLYHADPDVRHAVVLALSGHDDHVAIYSLIALTSDPSEHVRDWATFALGTLLETDSPEIRHALISRLVDSDNDTRAEALVGLARRGDRTVVPALEKELASDEVGCRVFDAVEIIGDPDLVKRAADFQRRLVH